ncbi:MAG: hypothetical protein KDD19_29575 [Phaeodactylibacter sp.]|nr:hypothetical protein [Phaeodactylibacter sp.]MCB9053340.1 hypothetical protein [Lewinellaceae bacterium]
MKTTTFLAAFALAATLAACSEDAFFDLQPPAALPLKEQLQNEEDCLSCRPVPGGLTLDVMGKEQLQDQEESRQGCPGCRPLPPGAPPPVFPLKEQLQGDSDPGRCLGCSP